MGEAEELKEHLRDWLSRCVNITLYNLPNLPRSIIFYREVTSSGMSQVVCIKGNQRLHSGQMSQNIHSGDILDHDTSNES